MDVKLVINHANEEQAIDNGEITISKKATYDEISLATAVELIKEASREADEGIQITVKVK